MSTRLVFLLFAAGVSLSIAGLRAQSIEGRVALPLSSGEGMVSARYQAPADATPDHAEVPAAVVYLEGNFAAKASPVEHSVIEMAQRNIRFSPGLLAIRSGTTVAFPNLDDTYHNVFSYSKTKRFDLGRYRKGEKPGVVQFDKPGVVSLHCEIHGNMRGTILVLDTPYFQKTDAQGGYRLGPLPSGNYVLKAWVSEGDVRSQPVEVKRDATLRADFPAK
jgi:plastocyanin